MLNPDLFAKLDDNTGYDKTNQSEILNPYVAFHNHEGVQALADTMVAESIQMRGIECYFIPREYVKPDMLFGEDLQSKFTKAWKIAAYLDSFESYSGANTFFSKFGMSVNDEITLSINPGLFKRQANGSEPSEGDLIYFKMDNSLFEIIWVQPYDPFYQVGQNAIRKITAQKFVYSGEELKPELQVNEGINIPEFSDLDLEPIRSLDGLVDTNENQLAENNFISNEASKFVSPHVVVNNRGIESTGVITAPFDDDF